MSKPKPSQHSVLTQIVEEDIPTSEIELWSDLHKALAASKFSAQGDSSSMKKHQTHNDRPYRWQLFAASIFLLALAIALVTPPGNALGKQILDYFTPAKATSYPAPTAVLTVSAMEGQVENTPAPSPTPSYTTACSQTEPQRYACALAFAQERVNFPLKALPTNIPLELTGMDVDPEDGAISFYYGPNATIILTQRSSPFPQSIRQQENDNGEVPAEAVQPVIVNGQPGEYVEGGYILKPGSQHYTWEPSMSLARLRWQDGETWFEMLKPGTPEDLQTLMGDKESFIRLAESLVNAKEIMNP